MRTEQEIRAKIKGIRSWDYLLGDMPGGVALELMARSLEWALKEPGSSGGATWYCPFHRSLDCELCPKGK